LKELLTAIKTQLRNDSDLIYINDADIVITPDIDIIPISLNFPAILIKEDTIYREDRINIRWKVKMFVHIIALQLLKASDISIMGQATPKIYGILDIVDDIHGSLNNNTLSITGMQSASPTADEPGSEMGGSEDLVFQRKILTYEYLKNVTQ